MTVDEDGHLPRAERLVALSDDVFRCPESGI